MLGLRKWSSITIISLGFKQNIEFSQLYNEIPLAKLTNHSACIN